MWVTRRGEAATRLAGTVPHRLRCDRGRSQQGPPSNTLLFDFNNAFYGPRLVDLIDGAFEFSLAEKYIHLADFARFDALIGHYTAHAPLTADETATLAQWIEWIGVIKFTKEVRVLLQRNGSDDLRRRRALAIAGHLLK